MPAAKPSQKIQEASNGFLHKEKKMKKIIVVLSILVALSLLFGCTSLPKPGSVAKNSTSASSTPAPVVLKNLSLGKEATSNNHIYEFTASKAVDGDLNTYFEGAAKSYPNVLTVDLGGKKTLSAIVLKLNPKRIWQMRNQTVEIQTSDDGSGFTPAIAAKAYSFDPESKNEVNIPLDISARFIQLIFTANSESNAGQVAEIEVLGN